jgi:hypothetical protein
LLLAEIVISAVQHRHKKQKEDYVFEFHTWQYS